MKFNIVFGPGKADFFTSNIAYTRNFMDIKDNPENTRLSYAFNDKPLTQKFLSLWPEYRQQQIKNFKSADILNYHYNYYPTVSAPALLQAKKEMNETLDELRTFGYEIPDTLYLNNNVNDPENHKLNELHFVFETELLKLDWNTNPNYKRLYTLFEKVNNVVHFIELTPQTEVAWQTLDRHSNFNMAIRTNSMSEYYQLQDEDYADFGQPLGGDLVADFSTVGKDLFVCSCTNDVELVHRNSVNQQRYLTDYVFLMFSTHKLDPWMHRNHYKWCEDNKVGDYLDYNAPMYKPGRHVLGKNEQGLITGKDFYDHVIARTPELLGCYLSQDDGTPIF